MPSKKFAVSIEATKSLGRMAGASSLCEGVAIGQDFAGDFPSEIHRDICQ